jgi:hypothetical protein
MNQRYAEAETELLSFWRRMIRSQQAYTVLAIELAAVYRIQDNIRSYRVQQSLLREFSDRRAGQHFALSNGDIVIAVPGADPARSAAFVSEIVDTILPGQNDTDESLRRRVRTFLLPERFIELREWIGRYLPGGELANAPRAPGADDGAEPSLEAMAGPLTPYLLTKIEHRIARCDIRPFIQRQMVYARGGGTKTSWSPLIEERLIGVAELGKKLFPDVDIAQSSPFFGKFCSILDDRLIHHIMSGSPRFESRISINISLNTLFGRLFEAFAARIPVEERQRLHIELHCGELFREIGRAQEAIDRVRGHGFGIVVDGLTLELLPYVRVNKFDCDFLKIHLPKGDVRKLVNDACIKAIRSLSRDKIVFSRCDHEGALQIGQMLDIRMYQGWLVDTQVRKEKGRS